MARTMARGVAAADAGWVAGAADFAHLLAPVALARKLDVGLGNSPNPTWWCGEPPGTRTLNPLIKSQLLCQLS